MRFHVVALPHTQTTAFFSACAYTQKVINFCRMMKDRGHTVFLYSGQENDAPCDEHVPCISEEDRKKAVGVGHYTQVSWEPLLRHWQIFNSRAASEIAIRKEPRDFLCLIGGRAHKPIADALPDMIPVEFGVGYGGVFTEHRIFESYAWMHVVYGAHGGVNPNAAKGDHWFDAVIPGYLDPANFPYRGDHRRGNDYYLLVGRLGANKGENIAVEVCKRLGKRLVVAGPGVPPAGVEYAGVVGPEKRGELMAGATALFAPTTYIEPFGNVAIEAMACGTPVITTDWGAFTETVIQGETGFRCRHLREFLSAAEDVKKLDHRLIRRHVERNYSLRVIGKQYEDYFVRLGTKWGLGWYDVAKEGLVVA